MGLLSSKTSLLTVALFIEMTAASCSLPFLSKPIALSPKFTPKPAKLSGILDLKGDCTAGYYQIRLQGQGEGTGVQVESQSDQTGRFSLVAPPGKYLLLATKEHCGAREEIELEDNTEHMVSVVVSETRPSEAVGQNDSRLPASILVLPKK